jgi:hypothetical protein
MVVKDDQYWRLTHPHDDFVSHMSRYHKNHEALSVAPCFRAFHVGRSPGHSS